MDTRRTNMTYISNGTRAAQKWSNYDRQTQTKTGPDGKKHVDHGASAVENLKEAGRNILHAVDPTNHFRHTRRELGGFFGLFAILMAPSDLAREILDIPLAPFKVVKNLGDAAAHGVMAGLQKVSGRE